MNATRDQRIDLVKIVAMFCVVETHIYSTNALSMVAWIMNYHVPSICLPMFIMVSGYLMSRKTSVTVQYIAKKVWGILRFVFIIILLDALFRGSLPSLSNILDPFRQTGRYSYFWFFGALGGLYVMLPVLLKIIHSKWLLHVVVGLGIVLSAVFVGNWFWGLEDGTVHTLRFYEWIFYFLLGAYLRKREFEEKRLYRVVLCMGACLLTFFVFHWTMPGRFYYISYMYCCPLGILLAIEVFGYIMHFRVSDNKYITVLSNMFLPIYTLHFQIIIYAVSHGLFPKFPGCEIVELAVVATVSVVLSYLIMRSKVGKWVFRL